MTNTEKQWLGERVYQNECSSRFECLTSWNAGEAFPSLGIGHFIWYRQGQSEPFEETFPLLLDFYRQRNIELPVWIEDLETDDSPWDSREHFQEDLDSERSQQLRLFLGATTSTQVEFIVQRLQQQLPAILATTDSADRAALDQRVQRLANSDPPYGIFALIDYLHFKGSGTNPDERYQGQGWGLLQVLSGMQQDGLQSFVDSATAVLERRVLNAPLERDEQRWLVGWINRLQAYLPR